MEAPETLERPRGRAAMGRIRPGAKALAAALICLIAVLGIAALLYRFWRPSAASSSFQTMKITRMTTTGKATNAVISPDGKFIVHVMSESGQQSLWLRQVATSSNVEIVPPAHVDYLRLIFSPDGNYLYYVAAENNRPATLYQMPALGGAPRKLMTNIGAFMALSQDGARVAFIRRAPDEGKDVLVISNVDGSDERRLVERNVPETMLYNGGSSPTPAWSPDGKRIAFASYERGSVYAKLVVVEVDSGLEETLSSEKWYYVGQLAWLPDASGLLLLASGRPGNAPQLWHVSYPEGSARRITNDLNRYTTVSVTADSGSLATVQTESLAYIWVVPEGDPSRARQITSGTGKIDISAVWTPDGKIVYDSRTGDTRTGDSSNIWIMDADGGNQKQLTFESGIDPDVTSDGRYIVFRSNRSGTPHIYRMEMDGGNLKQLTDGTGEFVPHLTPDGKWVFFNSRSSGNISVWRVSIDGGEAKQIVDHPSYNAHISPDGEWIACTYWDGQEDAPRRVAIIPIEGGQPVKLFDLPANIIPDPSFEWAPDGRALVYVDTRGGVSNLWSQPVDGGAPVQLTDFKQERIAVFNWSRDGQYLALSRGRVSSDVVLIKDFR
jgi:Tol biopolymer transport system component